MRKKLIKYQNPNGSLEEDRFAITNLPEVEITAPKRYFVGYDENTNPIYSEDYRDSQEYLQSQIPKQQTKRQQWALENVGANGQSYPGLRGDAKDLTRLSAMGIGTALTPIVAIPIARALQPTIGIMARPTSSVTRLVSKIAPKASEVLPYTETIDRGINGTIGALGVYDAGKGMYEGRMPWLKGMTQMALSGLMAADAAPLLRTAGNTVRKIEQFAWSPYTRKWTQFGNKEYRLHPTLNSGINPNFESRPALSEGMKKAGFKLTSDGFAVNPKNPNIRFVWNGERWISEASQASSNFYKAIEAERAAKAAKLKKEERMTRSILEQLDKLGFKDFDPRLWFQGRDWMINTPGAVTKQDIDIWKSHLPEYLDLAKKMLKDKSLYFDTSNKKWIGKFINGEMEVIPEEYIVANSKAFKNSGLYYDGQKWISGMSQEQFNELLRNGGLGHENWASNNEGIKIGGHSVSATYGPRQINMVGKGNNEKFVQSLPGAHSNNFKGGLPIGYFVDHSYDATHFTKYFDDLSKGYGQTKVYSPKTQIKAFRGNNGDFDMRNMNPYKIITIPTLIGGTSKIFEQPNK